jgi:hypothetical protein
MRAYHAEPNAFKRDEIAACQLHTLKQHNTGKLHLSDVKEMFEQMKDHAYVIAIWHMAAVLYCSNTALKSPESKRHVEHVVQIKHRKTYTKLLRLAQSLPHARWGIFFTGPAPPRFIQALRFWP